MKTNYSFSLWIPLTYESRDNNPCIPLPVYAWQQRNYGYDCTPYALERTPQPDWELVANLGDVSPEYGHSLVYIDRNGNYAPEVVHWGEFPDGDGSTVDYYRFICEPCTFIHGVLSDNPFHPLYSVWFNYVEIAESRGIEPETLVEWFLSSDARLNAAAWLAVGGYYGFPELDSYPERATLARLCELYSLPIRDRGNYAGGYAHASGYCD